MHFFPPAECLQYYCEYTIVMRINAEEEKKKAEMKRASLTEAETALGKWGAENDNGEN